MNHCLTGWALQRQVIFLLICNRWHSSQLWMNPTMFQLTSLQTSDFKGSSTFTGFCRGWTVLFIGFVHSRSSSMHDVVVGGSGKHAKRMAGLWGNAKRFAQVLIWNGNCTVTPRHFVYRLCTGSEIITSHGLRETGWRKKLRSTAWKKHKLITQFHATLGK